MPVSLRGRWGIVILSGPLAEAGRSKMIVAVTVHLGEAFVSEKDRISYKYLLCFFLWLLQLAILYHFMTGKV